MAYSDKVIEHYENPRNVGSFDKGDDTVGTGMVGAPACGDVMKLQIKVNPATGLIETRASRPTAAARRSRRHRSSPNGSRARALDEAMTIKNDRIARSWRCRR